MLFVFGMLIPHQSVLIPLLQVLTWLGLYGTIPGLVLVHIICGLPITTLVFRNHYATVRMALIEAARIARAGFYGIYRRVLMLISIPGIVMALICQFTSIWNDFLFAMVITQNPAVQPLTVGLNNLAGSSWSGTWRWPGRFWRRRPPWWCAGWWAAPSCGAC